jgi:Xaa-Pro aminopeptidase
VAVVTTAIEPAARPTIPSARYASRLAALRDLVREAGGAALLAGPGAELLYLTGYEAIALERLTLLAVPADGDPVLIVPRLEREPAERSPAGGSGLVAIRTWEETEDPYRLVAGVVNGTASARGGRLFVGDRLWAMFVLRIEAAFPGSPLALASHVLQALRVRKDAEEVELLRAAAHAADRVIEAMARRPLIGRTEADLAREVVERLLDEGHDSADHAQIIAAGPDSASPHHVAADRVVAGNEPLVFDIGGSLGGYASDMTRTFWVRGPDGGEPDPEFVAINAAVRRAYDAAVAAVRPGVPCEAIDAAARNVIAAAGYGPRFLHRTGHGIGLEVHEEPYLVGGNRRPLEPGHAFSIEPGIYLEGRFGSRLEDIVVCGPDGADVLNEAPKELVVVSG